MRTRLTCILLAILPWSGLLAEGRFYVDDKKAPENRKDLEAIQSTLIGALPKARAATVCIELDEGSGTGVIVSEEGLILTAAHVAAGVRKKVTVILEDGTHIKAETLGLDSEKDAAMIRITEPGKWPFVEIDRNNSTRLGDWVFALGHSGGFDKERGLVVRLGRVVRMAQSTYQSDCILIGGDSGGPLFDMRGRLVGINSRVGGELQENMHVPMSEFTQNWDAMLKYEFLGEGPFAKKPVKGSGFLGLATESRSEGGLKITKVGKNSPAENAGLKVGDVILKLNDAPLAKREDMQNLLKEMAVGDEITLEMDRGDNHETLTITLGAR